MLKTQNSRDYRMSVNTIFLLQSVSFLSMLTVECCRNPMDTSKPNRLREFLPSLRPSCLSLVLAIVCAALWFRNEATSDRLLALEKQTAVFTDVYNILLQKARSDYIPPTDDVESLRTGLIPGKTSSMKKHSSNLSGLFADAVFVGPSPLALDSIFTSEREETLKLPFP